MCVIFFLDTRYRYRLWGYEINPPAKRKQKKTDYKSRLEIHEEADDNDIIDMSRKAISPMESNGTEKLNENRDDDIIELSEEVKTVHDDSDIIDLTHEVPTPPKKHSASFLSSRKDDFGQVNISVSEQKLEAIIEDVVRKILAEKIDFIFMRAVKKVLREDIKKLKEEILQQHKNKD